MWISSGPWRELRHELHAPRVRLIESAPSSCGTVTRAIAVYDAEDFPEGDEPAASLWGDALDEYMYGEDGADEDPRDYPAGWITRQRERIAEDIYLAEFCHPVFPLQLTGSAGRLQPIERARVDVAGGVLLEQLFMVDVGAPTLYVALQRDPGEPAKLRIRGANHSHRDGQPRPRSWETMERSWGGRRFEFVAPWEPFWRVYEEFWRGFTPPA